MIIVTYTINNKVDSMEPFGELEYHSVSEHVNKYITAMGKEYANRKVTFEDVRDACQQGSIHISLNKVVININTI